MPDISHIKLLYLVLICKQCNKAFIVEKLFGSFLVQYQIIFLFFSDRLIDILMHKGEKNYQKFLEVLGIFYPDVYTEITGKKAPDPKSML